MACLLGAQCLVRECAGMRLDLGPIGKGYAVDRMADAQPAVD